MSNYRRPHVFGGTFFITQVTYQREPWLCSQIGRIALREGIEKVRVKYPFTIDAFVLLPDYFHCLWTLPTEDQDLSVRLRLIKTYVTKHYGQALAVNREVSLSRQKRGESNLWQRRFWATFIIREDLLDKIKAIAYWDRLTIKQFMDSALSGAIESWEDANGSIKPIPKR